MGLDVRRDLSIRALATNVGHEERLEELFGVTALATYGFHEVGTVAVECPVQGRTAHLRGRLPRPGGRRGDRRPAARWGDRGAGGHRGLQDRQPADRLQHHGPVLPLPAPAVRVRELAASDGSLRRSGRHHGQAAGGQRVARGDRRHRHRRRGDGARLLRPGRHRVGPGRAHRGRGERCGSRPLRGHRATVEQRLRDELGVRIGVEIVPPGSLDALTGQDRAKAKRFADERHPKA